MPCPL